VGILFTAFPFLMGLVGCFNITSTVTSRQEANSLFLKICQTEHNIKPLTHLNGNTLWVYLPSEEPILEYRPSEKGPKKENTPQVSLSLLFLDGRFVTDTFQIEYDIDKTRSYPNDNGISTVYTDEYTRKQNQLLTALFRSYADLEVVPGDYSYTDGIQDEKHQDLVKSYVKTDKPPEFIVIVIADIKKGLEVTTLFHFQDFKYYMTGGIPQEEFIQRNLSELKGLAAIIQDTQGLHLDYRNIAWPEFLIKQITNRIRFKYQTSDFKPSDDDETEIITIAAEALKSYPFSEFSGVKLRNLRDGKDYIYEKRLLETVAKSP